MEFQPAKGSAHNQISEVIKWRKATLTDTSFHETIREEVVQFSSKILKNIENH
jgi:hypothetical protein